MTIKHLLTILLHDQFHELNKCGDHEDEGDGLQVFNVKPGEHKLLEQPGYGGSRGHYKDYRQRHACRGRQFPGYTQKRTITQILHQQDVVHKYAADSQY